MFRTGNLFAEIPHRLRAEQSSELTSTPEVKIERIVSMGQATPAGEWLEQPRTEWVALLSGAAGLRFEDEAHTQILAAGDWIEIPANTRHRVEWTDAEKPTVWLAVHYDEEIAV
ncbi:MAG: cupin [Hyphomicrobiales bacterium]|jgi:cupin 2 domain-containing protein|nr:cupin [Hyphomicrobiales bacterium]